MKRAAFLVLGLATLGPTQIPAQTPMDLDRLVRRGELYLHPQTMAPYSGAVVGRYDAVRVRESGTLKDGRWDGVRETYHLNGGVALRETFREGRLDGPTEAYFRSGQLSARETYQDGVLHGPYESYWFNRGDESIQRVAERGHWAEGRPCGEWTSFGRSLAFPPCA